MLNKDSHSSYQKAEEILDATIKALFMFLVGCSLPKIDMSILSPMVIAGHVLALTVLSNLGKCFPMLCYLKEVPLKDRLALSVAMFPRGEVGAGILLIAITYGFSGPTVSLAVLSLAFNLVLTGIFVAVVVRLTRVIK